MSLQARLIVTTVSAGMIGLMSIVASTSLYAAPSRDEQRSSYKIERDHDSRRHSNTERRHDYKHRPSHGRPAVIHHGPAHHVRPDRIRRHHNVIIIRPHGHWYRGYGWHRSDHDAFKWLAFTAITLAILDNLNEEQQRAHEAAQVRATEAGVGETVIWNRGDASGSVTVLRDGTSTTGRYCREFQHEVTIGGKREAAYGTACRNPDGSWEVVSTRSP